MKKGTVYKRKDGVRLAYVTTNNRCGLHVFEREDGKTMTVPMLVEDENQEWNRAPRKPDYGLHAIQVPLEHSEWIDFTCKAVDLNMKYGDAAAEAIRRWLDA
jgi:hypothetical protein